MVIKGEFDKGLLTTLNYEKRKLLFSKMCEELLLLGY
jgi:hypothetical protein